MLGQKVELKPNMNCKLNNKVNRIIRPEFWDEKYQTGIIPWDFHGIPVALSSFLQTASKKGRVLIPGCGTGHEIKAFLQAGFDVCAIDFSKIAVALARKSLGVESHRVVHADFFSYKFESQSFDLIYERTFLCALPPEQWEAYAHRMAELLCPDGKLVGFFFYGEEPEPPPYPLTKAKAQQLLGSSFNLVKDENVTDSLTLFMGKEHWQEWQCREKK